ncbi:TPA: VWA domain-containing protein [Vibrio cholerae]
MPALPIKVTARVQHGVISVTAALMLLGMLTFFSFVLLVIVLSTTDSRLSMLADAVLYSTTNSYNAKADAQQMSEANTPQPNLGLSSLQVDTGNNENAAQVQVSGRVDRGSLALTDTLGTSDVLVTHQAQSKIHQTTLEIVVMLDVSNSMKGEPMTQSIKGLRDFADILYAEERRDFSKVVSIVPATGLVNIGHRPEFFSASAFAIPRDWRSLAKERGWKDLLHPEVPGRWRKAMCTALPEVQDELTSVSALTPNWIRRLELSPPDQNLRLHMEWMSKPAIEHYENGMPLFTYYYSGNPKEKYSPNKHEQRGLFDSPDCGVSQIQPLLSTRRAFIKALDTLYPEFNTNNAEGVMWAWRLLSPHWRGYWDKGKSELPRDYQHPNNRKVMLLFTDGNHLVDVAKRDRKQVALCREMKKQGIEIISIDFNNRSQVMKSCASAGQYYIADNRTIRTVLKQVATTLSKIELTQ